MVAIEDSCGRDMTILQVIPERERELVRRIVTWRA
jgi:hypothetical protein